MPAFMDPARGVFGEEAFRHLLTREAFRASRAESRLKEPAERGGNQVVSSDGS